LSDLSIKKGKGEGRREKGEGRREKGEQEFSPYGYL
jgi:hypothetical protein